MRTRRSDWGWLELQRGVPRESPPQSEPEPLLPAFPFPPRKKSLLVNNVFVVAAAILFGFSRRAGSFEMLVLGRLLMGVSAGMAGGQLIPPLFLLIHVFHLCTHMFSFFHAFVHSLPSRFPLRPTSSFAK